MLKKSPLKVLLPLKSPVLTSPLTEPLLRRSLLCCVGVTALLVSGCGGGDSSAPDTTDESTPTTAVASLNTLPPETIESTTTVDSMATTTEAAADESTTTMGGDDTSTTMSSTETTTAGTTITACEVLTAEEFTVVTGSAVVATDVTTGEPGCEYGPEGGEAIARLVLTKGMSAEMAVTQFDPGEFQAVPGIGEALVVSSTGRQASMKVLDDGYTITTLTPGALTADQLTELMRSIVAG